MTDSRILVVDDEPDIRELVKDILEDEGYQVETAENGETARAKFSTEMPDLVLLDIWMPDTDGITLLYEWQAQNNPCCPIVMISGHGTVETAVEATRAGAFDFVEKPLSLGKLIMTVEKALESGRNSGAASAVQTRQQSAPEPLGSSAEMSELRSKAEQVATVTESVLITGEAGSGKETLARYIHHLSKQHEGEFIVLDFNGVAENQLRQLLLGGAGEVGLLEAANNGTLYINDLGQTPELAQQILNTSLESGTIGNGGQPFTTRIIASCSSQPEQLLKAGTLNKELYFRLNVLPLAVPALRDRQEDIIELLRYYTEYFPSRENLPYRHFSVAAQNRLRHYDWPGNVRELRNMVKRLLIMGQGQEVNAQEVDAAIKRSVVEPVTGNNRLSRVFELPLREAREQFEREYLTHQLREAGGSVGKLAVAVGMERTHLYRKLRALGIDPKSVKS
ncbi:MAG: sigma-54-dependent Fis family transcriptional regulator [Proteobacteria bacterium]|nr:sigma-54-dependent Fis family transcriptional regulator [Pseudomonadota bacterium]